VSWLWRQRHNGTWVQPLPAANEISKSARITVAFDPPFALDLIVRTPGHVERDLREGDAFMCEALQKGKVLYDSSLSGCSKSM